MITVNEAFRILQENLPIPKKEVLDLGNSYSRYLAEDIHAPEPSPRYTNSAMDGYAVRWDDVKDSTSNEPASVSLVGESQAGIPYPEYVNKGEAVRISTGAVLPDGADTVVRVEDTVEMTDSVQILSVRSQGQDVRLKGEEFEEGDLLLSRGAQLKTRQLAMLASVGRNQVRVYGSPAVALIVTGTELVSSNEDSIKPFQIRDSNTVMLENAVRENGGEVIRTRYVADDFDSTRKVIEEVFSEKPEIMLCSGGVSVGRHDHVKKAAEQAGFEELFWSIRQKPGKPLFVARRDNTLLFGLPGNPVSAYMCYSHYVRPILSFLQGQHVTHSPLVTARIPDTIANKGKRTNFIRVKIEFVPGEIPRLTEVAKQGSHMLSSITSADGYIIMEPGESLRPGDLKEVYLF